MANRQILNQNQPLTVAHLNEIIQHLTNLNISSQVFHNNAVPNHSNDISHNRHGERKENKQKGTRRRPRKKKNKAEPDEASTSLHSFSSNSSVSASPLKTRVIPKPNILNKNIRHESYAQEPSTSKTIDDKSGNSVFPVTFSIKPAKISENGVFIRKRTIAQFINLRSFVKKNSCLIFESKLFIKSKSRPEKPKIQLDKVQLKKYPKKESRWERKMKKLQKEDKKFPEYFSDEKTNSGLSDGSLIKGNIRINPKNFRESYVSNEDSSITDYIIVSVTDRNQALEGDEVVLQIKPKEQWAGENKTASVVYIKEKVHPRQAIGVLKYVDPKEGDYALFLPRDKRFPIMRILQLHWPNGFKQRPKEFEDILFLAKLLEWTVPEYATGITIEKLGQSGDLKIESMSILKEFNLDVTPFSEELKEDLPQFKTIPEKEFQYREDVRNKCIFTIDPSTARDLDDAVSVEILPNGNYEVGVHISDASFYLQEGTELDQVVSKKATTIYLVDSVYHMLPQEMCLGCSLLPGEDKLSFSVFWEMTPRAEVLSKRFTRTIMNSCAKLAYEHAQMVIDNPDKEFDSTDFPQIHNGYESTHIVKTINILQSLAAIMRENRFKNGALRIDNLKLLFELNPATGEPLDYSVYQNQESHRLIEEFMLLANISVAQKIQETFPEIAFLRCHEPPKKNMLVQLQNKLATYGIHLKISSSGAIQASLKKYHTEDYAGYTRNIALSHLIAKPMTRARYLCSGTAEKTSHFKHYALSVPIYTHFTSPIRRYADIMVHRLLAATLDYREQPEWDIEYVESIAKNCNTQKYQAKRAQDASMELYLAHYVEAHKPFKQDCVVVDVGQKKFDVIVLKTGTIVRVYNNICKHGTKWEYEPNKLTITFPERKTCEKVVIVVELFSVVKVDLIRKDSYHLEGHLARPKSSYKKMERK